MNANCSICGEVFLAADDIFATPCGHVFHLGCVSRWIERSKTCPQCRKRTVQSSLLKVYFTFSSGEGVTADPAALQSQLDSLRFDHDALRARLDECTAAKSEATEKCSLLKRRLAERDYVATAMKERIENLQTEVSVSAGLREEISALRAREADADCLRRVLSGTELEVRTMLESSPDPRRLCTYVAALRKSVIRSEDKKRALAEELRVKRSKLAAAETERDTSLARVRLLESSVAHLETERDRLRKRLAEYEIHETVHNDSDHAESSPSTDRKRKTSESDDREDSKRPRAAPDIADLPTLTRCRSLDLGVKSTDGKLSSPYLSLKQSTGLVTESLSGSLTDFSDKGSRFYILKNRNALATDQDRPSKLNAIRGTTRKETEMETVYDGLGGHDRPTVFPVPSRTVFSKKIFGRLKK